MQRMTASGTMPSTGWPAASSPRICELETGTWGPSIHGPPARGNGRHGAAGPGHDGQGDQPPEVVVAVPGAEVGHQVGPDHQEELDGLSPRWARSSSAVSTE